MEKQLRDQREEAGLTQQEAADLVEVSVRTWQRWEHENGYDMPSVYLDAFRARIKTLSSE